MADETPEGRSIAVLAKERYGLRGRELHEASVHFIPFTAQTRMSGVDIVGDGTAAPPHIGKEQRMRCAASSKRPEARCPPRSTRSFRRSAVRVQRRWSLRRTVRSSA